RAGRRALRPLHVLRRTRPLPAADHRLHLSRRCLGRSRPAGWRLDRCLPAGEPARDSPLRRRADPRRKRRAACRAPGNADRDRAPPRAAAAASRHPARTHPARPASCPWRNLMTPFEACIAALKQPGLPNMLFATLDRALADTVGHKLFTLLYVAPNGKRV